MITESSIRELSTHLGEPAVSTVYLDLDGRHRPIRADYEAAFERLADDLRRRARSRHDERLSRGVDADLECMRAWLGEDLDRAETRGVAMFSCSEQGFFDAVELPRSVRDQAALGPTPRVSQLLALLDKRERFLLALVDRRHLRLLHFEFGEAEELPGVVDPEPRAVDTSVEVGSFERHSEEVARVHFRRVGDRVARALAQWPADRLIVGGPDESVAGLEEYLPESARDRIVGRVSVRVSATLREIAAASLEVEEAVERRREADLVEQLRERVASGRGGLAGLEAVLAALSERRVGTLLVSDGFVAPGATCPACGRLSLDVGQCPACGTANVEIDDIVEAAVDAAVAQDARVEFSPANELDSFGRIGALERY